MDDQNWTDLKVQRLSDRPSALGESPIWDAQDAVLWTIDGVAGHIHRHESEPDTCYKTKSWTLTGHIGAITLASKGHLMVMQDHGFYAFDPKKGTLKAVYEIPNAPAGMRLNDAKLDRQGRIICAGMGRAADPIGTLHQLDGTGRYRNFGGAFKIGNGVCFSPEGDTLYFSDTAARQFFACDYDPLSGDVGTAKLHIDGSTLGSGIDGATVDQNGNIWAALIHAGDIGCFSPEGHLLHRIKAPIDLPSSVGFAGMNMETLIVTSIQDSGTGRAISKHPDGGHVFSIEGLGAKGIPDVPFELVNGASND